MGLGGLPPSGDAASAHPDAADPRARQTSPRPRRERRRSKGDYLAEASSLAASAMADLRLAAWFAWMTPLLAALSS